MAHARLPALLLATVAFSGGVLVAPAHAGRVVTRVITQYEVPTKGGHPWGIAAGPDGNLWFTELLGNKVGRLTTDGLFTEYLIPTRDSFPREITAGPDGNL